MDEKKLIGKTANGVDVYVIVNNEHMQAHSDVREAMIAEAIKKMTYENTTFKMETFDMGRNIGVNACVKTGPEDMVVEVPRPGRTNKSRIVCNREPEPTSLFTVGVCTDDDKLVTVFTAFPGPNAPKEMTDPRLTTAEKEESIGFWCQNALCSTAVFGQPVPPNLDQNQEIRIGSCYEVWSSTYNWDEQASDYYLEKTFNTLEAAKEYESHVEVEESYCSYTFVTQALRGGRRLVITDKANPKKTNLPNLKMRSLTQEEIAFIQKIGIKYFRPSSYEIGAVMRSKFGDNEIQGYYEAYNGPANIWFPRHDVFDDNHLLLIEYDIETGEATISTELKILEFECQLPTREDSEIGEI